MTEFVKICILNILLGVGVTSVFQYFTFKIKTFQSYWFLKKCALENCKKRTTPYQTSH